MKEYLVNYKGINYSNVGYYLLGLKIQESSIIKISDSVPCIIDSFTSFEENKDFLLLKKYNILFDFVDGKPIFSENCEDSKTISFDKNTLRANGEKISLIEVEKLSNYHSSNRPCFLKFISSIINLNNNVKNYFDNMPSFMIINSLKTKEDSLLLKNLYNMIIFNLPEFEKIINSKNDSFLKNNLRKENFEISEANKLHQVVGLPKFAVQAIKELKFEEYIEEIKELSTVLDGNSLNIVLNFLAKSKLIFDSEYSGNKKVFKKEKMSSFLKNLTKICQRKTYKITDLLNYFLRQSFYASTTGYFRFPCDEAMYLSDYLDMCEKYGLKVDKYPSQLKRMHDIISKNVSNLEINSDSAKKEFEDAISNYVMVERNDIIVNEIIEGIKEIRKYSFIVPKTIKDIVEEGNVLHHCVGSYSNKIINGESRIVFMRDSSDIKTPLVTIDIDEHFNLVEAKKAFNEDVDILQKKAIDLWLKDIRRI